jgi:hypothetical protein
MAACMHADHFNFCIVPDSAADAVLFAAVALLVACTASTQNTAINVLVAGRLAWDEAWMACMHSYVHDTTAAAKASPGCS